jgi:hypothetical protein
MPSAAIHGVPCVAQSGLGWDDSAPLAQARPKDTRAHQRRAAAHAGIMARQDLALDQRRHHAQQCANAALVCRGTLTHPQQPPRTL